jgi:small subunit ribosomal protein S2
MIVMNTVLSINKFDKNLKSVLKFKSPEKKNSQSFYMLTHAKQCFIFFFYYGVHIGHKSLKVKSGWHPFLSKFILTNLVGKGSQNNTSILNIRYTLTSFLKAIYILTLILKSKGDILIVNTNPEYSKLLHHTKKNIKSSKIFYSDCHWVGGTLTNWVQISQSVITFKNFYKKFDDFLLKNNINFPRYKKMKKSFQGFINLEKKTVFKKNSSISITLKKQTSSMPTSKSEIFKIGREVDWKPDLIFILNSNSAESIIKEACNLKIPIIALTDSNTNISNITYPIPTNTNSFFFAWFCLDYITKLVNKYSKF